MFDFYNSHIHIFNVQAAPDRFFKNIKLGGVFRFLANYSTTTNQAVALFSRLLPGESAMFERYGNFVKVGIKRTQRQVFEDLKRDYAEFGRVRFVVLPMDMDFMGGGTAEQNYLTQLYELKRARLQNINTLLPFIAVDPRRQPPRESLLDFVKKHIEGEGFIGIKMYPSLGFFPFDQRLLPIYEYAAENEIPIITHCETGGIYYLGQRQHEHLQPGNLDGEILDKYNFTSCEKEKPSVFKNVFLDPVNYQEIFDRFENIKICFAHYGGTAAIVNHDKEELETNQPMGKQENARWRKYCLRSNWYKKIKEYMIKYPNAYADVSYTLHNTKKTEVIDPILQDILDEDLGKKVIFGTDYFMTVREKPEIKLVKDFKQMLDELNTRGVSYFHNIAKVNNENYLRSKIFDPSKEIQLRIVEDF